VSGLHRNLPKEHARELRKLYRAGCSPSNDFGRGSGFDRQAGDGIHPETRAAATILQFFAGLRGRLLVTFEESTCAAWLYDLLKPHVAYLILKTS
jgi:hypothetical protein